MGLEGLPDAAVPEQFQLAIDRERGARLCRQVWRHGARIGAQFLSVATVKTA
jgi:hypothetical protein